MVFDFKALQDILVCPKSKRPLVHEGHRLVSTDPETRLAYEIRDEIPIMLIEEARELPREEWAAIMQKHGQSTQVGA